MAVDPTQLSQTDKQHLADLAEKTGDETVREAVNAFLERSAEQSEPNGAPPTEQTRPIWEVFEDIMSDVPQEVIDTLPTDAAAQHDHYIYGLPKKSV